MLKIIDGNGRTFNDAGFDEDSAVALVGTPGSRFRVKAVDLGNGHIEATASRVIDWQEADWSGNRAMLADVLEVFRKAREEADPAEVEARNRERAARRARTRVRRLCKAMGADTLLTLTYRACEADLARVKADLKEFNRRVLRVLPGFCFVACFELQKRGAWHVHMATRAIPRELPTRAPGVSFKSFNVLRAIWRSVTKDRGGNVDVARRKFNSKRSAAQVAAYIAKYIGKAFTEGMDEGVNRWTKYGKVETPAPVDLGVVDSLLEAITLTYGLLDKDQSVATAALDRWQDWFFVSGERVRRRPILSPSS